MQMRWRRATLFAAIVIAHIVVVRLLPIGRATLPEPPVQEVSLTAPQSREPAARPVVRAHPAEHGTGVSAAFRSQPLPPFPVPGPPKPGPAAPAIDWGQEAAIAADDRLQRDAQAARQLAALSRWKLNALPAPVAPAASAFPWDHARTHRFEPTPQGLLVNLSDRCVLLINPLAVLGGCRLGALPVHADLFAHMDAALELREAAAH
jgi:hypothetical protein